MDLKPCPFCGNEYPTPKGGFEWCKCTACSASVDRIEDWNTRPREDALQAEVESLREALTFIQHFAVLRSNDPANIALRVLRGSLRTIANKADTALKGAPHE